MKSREDVEKFIELLRAVDRYDAFTMIVFADLIDATNRARERDTDGRTLRTPRFGNYIFGNGEQ